MVWGVAQFLRFLFGCLVLASYQDNESTILASTEGSAKQSVSSETFSQEVPSQPNDMFTKPNQQIKAKSISVICKE